MKNMLSLNDLKLINGGGKVIFKSLVLPQYANAHVNNKQTFLEEDLKALDEVLSEKYNEYIKGTDIQKAVIRENIFFTFKDNGINMYEYRNVLESFGLSFY